VDLLTKHRVGRIDCMGMPPLTSPDRPLNPVFWRILLLLACVLVFSFALHAKLAVYEHAQPHPSTSSKLWNDTAKFQTTPLTPTTPLIWLAVFLSAVFCLKNSARCDAARISVAIERPQQQYLQRFLRPPPSR